MTKRSLRVLTLMHPDLIPPRSAPSADVLQAPWRAEYNVLRTLEAMGHRTHVLGLYSDLGALSQAYEDLRPHITFNLLEEFGGYATFDQHVVSYMEVLHKKFTGNGARGLMLARDKALSKKILAYHKIPVPNFQVFHKHQRIRPRSSLQFPYIVKSLTEEASLGISQASVVTSKEKLIERVAFIFEHVGTHAIAERYIEGRELYVGIMGNQRLTLFPPWELHFNDPQTDLRHIATTRVKHNANYRQRHGIDSARAEQLPAGLLAYLSRICKRAYRALHLSGYARIDLRLSQDGIPFVLEANPNPDISEVEDFAQSARHAGISYKDLLQRIIDLGLKRRPELL